MVILNSLSGLQLTLRSESPWRPEIRGTGRADLRILALCTWGVNGKPPQPLVVSAKICGKFALPNFSSALL